MSAQLWIDFEEPVLSFDVQKLQDLSQRMMVHAGITQPVNLLFCTAARMQDLNHNYRGKQQPTDILSFAYEGEDLFGDLAICLDIAKEQSKEYHLSLQEELLRLIAHGLVHLQGYDHETEAEEQEMLSLEKKLLSSIGLEALYP